ncbi:uncharacterized protein BX663DRAFT_536471 [Cokeromyces recurvatus]|uniref:uncharacterized protein n=1 Tax=Cokeromyces recurvatus TaxID=90255 RepID=UPI0022208166|nr:uncharacterized protein BX663DRAFT_536471 [Cokeromyces recurvatus]KAI7903126.1 hypothetical protein BX663DRAFT_536471 [Cokeromyces recurvatus]
MGDYLETPDRTTLKTYVDANQSSLMTPDIKLDIEEAWTETKVQRTANIQTSRVAAALLKACGKKAVNLLKSAGPSYTDISNAFVSPSTEPAANTSTAEANGTADNHNTNIINDNVVSSSNVEEENTEKLLFVLTEDEEFKTLCIILYF